VTEKRWKRAERRIAELLGGKRVPVSGRQRGATPDILHATLAVEVKSRKKLPDWIGDALEQAEASAGNGQLPVAVLHERGRRYKNAFVVMRLRDFR
jgi:hypothetical protein